MTLLLTGLSYRTTPVELRGQCYLSVDHLTPALQHIRSIPGVDGCVIVSTCNRMEIYATGQAVLPLRDALQKGFAQVVGVDALLLQAHFYTMQDDTAVDHLLNVVCGLDSMVLGETQILGQVGKAYQVAQSSGTTDARLNRLLEKAIHTGKRAHTETDIQKKTVSISHAGMQLAVDALLQSPDQADVLVIGAGEMAELAVDAARAHSFGSLRIINRTYEHAYKLAVEVGAIAHPWHELWQVMAQVDVIIAATGAPHTVLQTMDVQHVQRSEPLIIVDLAVPRDVEASVRDVPGVTLYHIDDMQQVVDETLAFRESVVPQVKAIVAEEGEAFQAWLQQRAIVPTITDLRRQVKALAEDEVAAALHRLNHLPEKDQAVVQRLAHRLVNKILHAPTVNLRQHAIQDDAAVYAEIVRDLFALEVSHG